MITLFRRIREQLIASGSLTKYLLYAIGEILLVVIGILIALQINNWNEDRKKQNFEMVMLKEIEMALVGDSLIVADYFEPRIDRRERAAESLTRIAGERSDVDEQVFLELYDDLGTTFEYRFNVGPYETIKSNGLDVISNDSLRSILTATYERTLSAYKVFVDYPVIQNSELIQSLEQDFLTQKVEWHEDEWHIHPHVAVNEVFSNPSFIQVLAIESDIARNYRLRMDQIKQYTEDLRKAVRAELTLRGK